MSDDIEFVSYTGAYPNLCRGELTVRIRGRKYVFGNRGWDFRRDIPANPGNLEEFWMSGGCVRRSDDWSDMWAEDGPWVKNWSSDKELRRRRYPKAVMDRMDGLLECFNENVRRGCCGGCI